MKGKDIKINSIHLYNFNQGEEKSRFILVKGSIKSAKFELQAVRPSVKILELIMESTSNVGHKYRIHKLYLEAF